MAKKVTEIPEATAWLSMSKETADVLHSMCADVADNKDGVPVVTVIGLPICENQFVGLGTLACHGADGEILQIVKLY